MLCVEQAARELADGTLKPKPQKVGWLQWALEKNPIGLNFLFKKAREEVKKNVSVLRLFAVLWLTGSWTRALLF